MALCDSQPAWPVRVNIDTKQGVIQLLSSSFGGRCCAYLAGPNPDRKSFHDSFDHGAKSMTTASSAVSERHLSNWGPASISIRLRMVGPISNEELPARDPAIHCEVCTTPNIEQADLTASHSHLHASICHWHSHL